MNAKRHRRIYALVQLTLMFIVVIAALLLGGVMGRYVVPQPNASSSKIAEALSLLIPYGSLMPKKFRQPKPQPSPTVKINRKIAEIQRPTSTAAALKMNHKAKQAKAALAVVGLKVPAHQRKGKYTVQVGSYRQQEVAENRTLTLKDKGYTAFYAPIKNNSTTWYRVHIGLYSTKKGAYRLKRSLQRKENFGSTSVRRLNY